MNLSIWQNFYVIVGAAAGSLTGLQFVVMTLVAQSGATSSAREISAFGTPTIVHFCAALLISALMCAPFPAPHYFAACLAIGGVAGVIYSLTTIEHARKASYNPDLGDWIWYVTLPLLTHLALAAAGVIIWWNAGSSGLPLWLIAADSLSFLFLGIHNSWDTVTYVAIRHSRK
jgi:hypothetical protein